MTQTMQGADIVELRSFAGSLDMASAACSNLSSRLTSHLDGLTQSWAGQDFEQFASQWTNELRGQVESVATALGDAAATANRNAKEQEQASAADGAGGLSSLLNAEPTPNKPDPNSKLPDGTNTEYVDRELYNTNKELEPVVSPDDIEQGAMGDCWLISSIQAIASTNPEIIENAITQNLDGTYTVRLYENGKPIDVIVDGSIVTDGNGNPLYADSPHNVLWPSILEKAVAQHLGGYDKLNGYPDKALELLTGASTHTERPRDFHLPWNQDRSISEVSDYIDRGGVIVATTMVDGKGRHWYTDAPDGVNLISNHSYSIVGVDEANNTITVRNPHPGGETVTMPFDSFQKNMRQIDYALAEED